MVKQTVGWFALVLVLLTAATWAIQGSDFALYRFFAPKQEAVRREVFEQSKAYNQGMVQEIQNMQFEYVKATPDQKAALASIILHRTADFDMSKLSPDTRAFIDSLRATAMGGAF